MADPKVPYGSQMALLDRYVASVPADPLLRNLVLDVIKRDRDLRRHFFQQRPDHRWFKVLAADDFFAVEASAGSTHREISPFGELQNYLAAIAQNAPALVVEHVESIDAAPPSYRSNALMILSTVRPEESQRAWPTVLRWVNDDATFSALSTAAIEFTTTLARSGCEFAFALMPRILRPRLEVAGSQNEAAPFLRGFAFDLTFKELIDAAASLSLERTAEELISLLSAVIDLEAGGDGDRSTRQSWWRSSIEDSNQNLHQSYKDTLLTGLRVLLEQMVAKNRSSGRNLIDRCIASKYAILHRMGLHLLRAVAREHADLIARLLTDPEEAASVDSHHEYFLLLRDGFAPLGPEDRDRLLRAILAGPEPSQLERIKKLAEDAPDIPDAAGYVELHRKSWIRDRLWMIREHLVGEPRAGMDQLVAELGDPEHPEFRSYVSEVYSIENRGPLSLEELRRLSPEELKTLVASWIAPRRQGLERVELSYHGFGEQLAALIHGDPERYASVLRDVALANPDYAQAIWYRLRSGVSGDGATLWRAVLGVGEDLAATALDGVEANRWEHARLAYVHLLEAGLTSKAALCPDELVAEMNGVLLRFAGDPSPANSEDASTWRREGWGNAMWSLNSVRPVVYRSCIELAWRASERIRVETPPPGAGPSRLSASGKGVLESALNRSTERHPSSHFVFGEKFEVLVWLDLSWVGAQVAAIFPQEADPWSRSAFQAAWEGFLMTAGRYEPAWKLACARLPRLIQMIGDGLEIEHVLISNLAGLLLRDFIDNNEERDVALGEHMLFSLYAQASSGHLDALAWVLWRMSKDLAPEVKVRVWPTLKALWRWRLTEVSRSDFAAEHDRELERLADFVESIPEAEPIKSLWPMIEVIVGHARARGWSFSTWRKLEAFAQARAEHELEDALALYELMWMSVKGRSPYLDEINARALVLAGIGSTSKARALDIVDRMMRAGVSWSPALYGKHSR